MGNKTSLYQEKNIQNNNDLQKEVDELSYLDNIHVINKKNLSIDYRYLLKSNIEKNINSPKNQMLKQYRTSNDNENSNMRCKAVSSNNINNEKEDNIREIIMKKKLLERELELLGLGNELKVLKNEIKEKQKRNYVKDDNNSVYTRYTNTNINTIQCLTGKALYN